MERVKFVKDRFPVSIVANSDEVKLLPTTNTTSSSPPSPSPILSPDRLRDVFVTVTVEGSAVCTPHFIFTD